jgi:hypothetical protein
LHQTIEQKEVEDVDVGGRWEDVGEDWWGGNGKEMSKHIKESS